MSGGPDDDQLLRFFFAAAFFLAAGLAPWLGFFLPPKTFSQPDAYFLVEPVCVKVMLSSLGFQILLTDVVPCLIPEFAPP